MNISTEQCCDRIMILKELEETSYKRLDYFQIANNPKVLESRRVDLCEWMYEFVDTYGLERHIVSRAMFYFDRFLMISLAKHPYYVEDEGFLELLTMTALNISIKLYSPRKWDMSHMVKCSNGKFNAKLFISMECKMFNILSWRVNPPTSLEFVLLFLSMLYTSIGSTSSFFFNKFADISMFFTELSVLDYTFIACSPSVIAIASIYNAIDNMDSCRLTARVRLSFLQILKLVGMQPSQEYLSYIQMTLQDHYLQSLGRQKIDHVRLDFSSPISVSGL